MIRLIAGLGNPGAEYAGTRHNAGFQWTDALAREWGLALRAERAYCGRVARTQQGGHPVWLLQPQTFMNDSGKSVAPLARFFKIAPEEILVVHDELDLVAGQARLKRGGSHAGHNGIKSIEALLGSADFWRLRIGVGHPGVKSEVIGWVLARPAPAQREAIAACMERTLAAVPELVAGEFEAATRIVNVKPHPLP